MSFQAFLKKLPNQRVVGQHQHVVLKRNAQVRNIIICSRKSYAAEHLDHPA